MDAYRQDKPRRNPGRRAAGRAVGASLLATSLATSVALGVAWSSGAGAAPAPGAVMAGSTSTTTTTPSPTETTTTTTTPSPTETTTTTTTPTPTPTPVPVPLPNPSTVGSDLTVVQANVESPQSVAGFQADARTVFAQSPDLITWNEVAFRQDVFLAPPGYALWRTPGQYTGATPVAWRTDKFTPIAQGTWMISDKRGIPPRKTTELGRRNANWVTLQGIDGRVVSLVSVHIAPNVPNWADLRRASVERLTELVGQLDDSGPVIVGGDFNMYHLGSGYTKDLFDAAGMVPTYDTLGTRFHTHDGGSVIDYLFVAGGQLAADVHYPVELNSDHDAVVAGMSWTTDAPNTVSRVATNPAGTKAEQRAVAKAVNKAISDAAKREHVWLATAKLDYPLIERSLKRAADRGVKVHVLTRSPKRLTDGEVKLQKSFEGDRGSWLKKCGKRCAAKWRAQDRPTTAVLVTSGSGTPRLRIDVSRYLRESIVTQQTSAVVSTGYTALTEGKAFFAKYS